MLGVLRWRAACGAPRAFSRLALRPMASTARGGPVDSDKEEKKQPELPKGFEFLASPSPLRASAMVDALPASVKPYAQLMRLDKPIGSWLLFWPGAWSIAMACHPGLPDWKLIATFAAGTLIMRGAGCTINDMWDRDIDNKVERTRTRPITSGAVSMPRAFIFLGAQLSAGLAILLSLNTYTIALGAASLAPVVVYPLMKRFTYWPQAVLGLAFNWGALLGWAAVHGSSNWAVTLPLYASGIAWTIVYDTIYAHQDKRDDVRVGVKSTALYMGDRTRQWLSGFGAAQAGLLALAGVNAGLGWPFYVGVAAAAGHVAWMLRSVDLDNPYARARAFMLLLRPFCSY